MEKSPDVSLESSAVVGVAVAVVGVEAVVAVGAVVSGECEVRASPGLVLSSLVDFVGVVPADGFDIVVGVSASVVGGECVVRVVS